jgi:hypothetical protein
MPAAWEGMWIAITGSVVGDPERGFRTEYSSDLREFSHKSDAVSHGFTLGRSDDFNLGFMRGGRLESMWWMDERVYQDPASLTENAARLAEIGREIGLTDK